MREFTRNESACEQRPAQRYFDESVTEAVLAEERYDARGLPDTSNARDNIFTEETLLTLAPERDGYLGTFEIGLRLT